ncbi:23431_t:CDS:2, partial [Gigaspora margarita]
KFWDYASRKQVAISLIIRSWSKMMLIFLLLISAKRVLRKEAISENVYSSHIGCSISTKKKEVQSIATKG